MRLVAGAVPGGTAINELLVFTLTCGCAFGVGV